MATNKKVITQIQYNDEANSTDYNLGVLSENVFIEENNNTYTLKNLYENLKNFFTNNKSAFAMYSNTEPTNSNVKIWYQTYSNLGG